MCVAEPKRIWVPPPLSLSEAMVYGLENVCDDGPSRIKRECGMGSICRWMN